MLSVADDETEKVDVCQEKTELHEIACRITGFLRTFVLEIRQEREFSTLPR